MFRRTVKDKNAAEKLYQMDDTVGALYRKYLREAITPYEKTDKRSFDPPLAHLCSADTSMRLERISDHACYIGDSVHYIVTGTSEPKGAKYVWLEDTLRYMVIYSPFSQCPFYDFHQSATVRTGSDHSEVRKVQFTGRSTYILSLSKEMD